MNTMTNERRFCFDMRTLFFAAAIAALSIIGIASTTKHADAYVCIYQQTVGGAIGDFNNAANWTGCNSAAPQPGDDVVIVSGTSTQLSANAKFAALNTSGTVDALTFDLMASSTVTVNNGGVVTSTSGNLGFGGSLNVGNAGTSALGTISGTINVSSSAQFLGASTKFELGSSTSTFYSGFTIGQSATVNGNTGKLEFIGNPSISAATWNMGSATVYFTGGEAQTLLYAEVNNTGFGNVKVNKTPATTLTLSGNGTSTGTFTIERGTLSLGTNTLNVGVNFNVNGGVLTAGTGTLNLNGSGAQTVSSTALYNLSIAKSGNSVTFLTNVTSTNNFTITGGTLDLGTVAFDVGGDFVVNGGVFTPGTATTTLHGANSQSVSSTSFAALTIDKSAGTVTFTGNTTSTGGFNLTGGTLSLGTNRFNVGGDFAVKGGVFTPGTATTTLNGASGQSVSSTSFYDLVIDKSGGTATLSTNATTTGNFALLSGTLSLGTKAFDVGGGFTVNGGVFTPGTATTTLNGAAPQSVSSTSFAALTIDKSAGTVTFTGNTTSTGGFNLTGGTLSLGTNRFNVGGDFAVKGGVFTPGTATTTLNGASGQSVSSTSFYDLVIDKSGGTATLSTNATTTGNFALLSGTLSLGTKAFDVGGGFTVNGGVFTPGTATTTLNGAAPQSVSSTSFAALTIDKPAGIAVTFSGNTTSTGGFKITGGTLSLETKAFDVGGDFVVNGGVFTPGTATTTLNGASAQSVSSTSFMGLVIDKSAGTVTFTGNTTSTAGLRITGGTLSLGTNRLNVGGDFEVNGGTFTPGTGLLVLNGASAQSVSSTSFEDLTIDKSGGTVTPAVNTTSTGNLVLLGGTLALGTKALDIGGDFTVNGGVFTPGTATTTLNGASAQSVSSTSFMGLVIDKSAGTVTFTGNTTSTAGFRITGGTLSLGTNRLNVGGDFEVNGGTFTPGTGLLVLNGAAAQSVSSTSFEDLTIDKSGGTVTPAVNTTSTGNLVLLGGTLALGTKALDIGGDFTVNGGVFTPGTATTTLNGSGAQSVSSTAFTGLVIDGGTVTFTGNTTSTAGVKVTSGTFSLGSNRFNIGGDFVVNGGTFTPGTGLLVLNGAAAQSVSSTSFEDLTIDKSGGTVTPAVNTTSTGNLVLLGGTLALGTKALDIGGDFTVNGGVFTPSNATTTLNGSGAQSVSSTSFGPLAIDKSAGTVTFAGNTTSTGGFKLTGGTLSLGTKAFAVGGDFIVNGGVFTPGTATTTLNGAGAQSVSSTGFYDVVVSKSAGTATLSHVSSTIENIMLLRSGTLNLGNGTTTFTGAGTPLQLPGGTFNPANGTVSFRETQTVASTTFYNLNVDPGAAKTASLNASTTVIGNVHINSNGTLAMGANDLTVLGNIRNTGLITVTTGNFIHTAESVLFTDSSGNESASYTNSATVYVTVQDTDQNMDGNTAETFTIPVNFNAAAGSDFDSLTLTETGASTGIFRSSGIAMTANTVAYPGNSAFELLASGIGTTTYVDPGYATDTASDTVTLTYSAAAASAATTGSTGGGGGGGYTYTTPVVVAVTTPAATVKVSIDTVSLAKIATIGQAVHNLVKLKDDGNSTTQEDSAVYYLGGDGRRHAFPNSKSFFSWYCDFSGVKIVSAADLASIPLGKNVTYRAGHNMVKFRTDNKVYAVTKGGVLRWVKTEALAIALYGNTWNKMIDDVEDTFYTNYVFGTDISATTDFSASTAIVSVSHPSDSMSITGYTESEVSSSAPVCSVKDTDNDGLSDADEAVNGTKVSVADTDGDGLKDGEEVNKYGTNPLKKDTDGDGYSDGVEVKAGKDPLKK